MKALVGGLAAGALLASASASAGVLWDVRGTVGLWAAAGPVIDAGCPAGFVCTPPPGDADTTFTLLATDFAPNTQVHFAEAEFGSDFYNVDFEHDGAPFIQGSFVTYRIDTTDPAGFNRSALGSQRFGPEDSFVQKDIFDAITGEFLLRLNSINEARDPSSGFAPLFAAHQHLLVTDTINFGTMESVTNEFTHVPEPATLALFGIGLLGLLGRRRSV